MGRKNNQLKLLANLAKKRMLNKEYEIPNIIHECLKPKVSSYFIQNAKGLKKLQAKTEFVSIKNIEDENFISQVVTMLKSKELLINPLGQLTDKNIYCKLSEVEKQSYMLRLSEKYNKIKDMFERQMLA